MIRIAVEEDVSTIMDIVSKIKEEMNRANNPQWDVAYPLACHFLEDIKQKALYVYEYEKKVVGFITILEDVEDEYISVLESSKDKAFIVHRLGVEASFRKMGIAQNLMQYAEDLARKSNVYLIKADTEFSNVKMNHLFNKMGYRKITTFVWPDVDSTFNYYEKRLGGEKNV